MKAMFEMVFLLTNKEKDEKESKQASIVFFYSKKHRENKKTQFSVFYFPLFILLISHNKNNFQNCDQKHP